MKKRLKQEKWEEIKVQRKDFMKDKKKEKKRLKNASMTVEQKKERERLKQIKKRDPSTIEYCGTLIMDMELSSMMGDREEKSLINQVCYSYGANVKMTRPFRMALCGYKGPIRDTMEKMDGVSFWKLDKYEEPYIERFAAEKESLVYLTSDSPNTITDLDPAKKYIIGAIVDHNRHKCLTYNKAMEQGIETARLPIGDYIQLSSRKVLTVNHVVEILIKFKGNGDWKKSFEEIIPTRKIAKDGSNVDGDDDEDYEEESTVTTAAAVEEVKVEPEQEQQQ
eukprot:gene9117-10692_t